MSTKIIKEDLSKLNKEEYLFVMPFWREKSKRNKILSEISICKKAKPPSPYQIKKHRNTLVLTLTTSPYSNTKMALFWDLNKMIFVLSLPILCMLTNAFGIITVLSTFRPSQPKKQTNSESTINMDNSRTKCWCKQLNKLNWGKKLSSETEIPSDFSYKK